VKVHLGGKTSNILANGYEPVLWGMATISALAAAAMVRVGQYSPHSFGRK
jgi:hypothetical protein